MNDVEEIYNTIYDSTYCINPKTKKLYFKFIAPLIQRYLADTSKNYSIYISTDKYVADYQKILPTHPKIYYTSYNHLPTLIPNDIDAIYIYHRSKIKLSKIEQLTIIDFVKTHPRLKYSFIGDIGRLLSVTYISLFKYYLHFQLPMKRFRGFYTHGMISYTTSRKMASLYIKQDEKKSSTRKPITIYDYFLFHDTYLDITKIGRFNMRTYKPRQIPGRGSTRNSGEQNNSNDNGKEKDSSKEVYIYDTFHRNPGSLVMPDGSKENYNELVKKYKDIIEV